MTEKMKDPAVWFFFWFLDELWVSIMCQGVGISFWESFLFKTGCHSLQFEPSR